ncbi:MAG: porin family protein [Caulobacterales bacterium]|nr:porin family protein [Caulobacterales bacterium]
MKIETLSAVVGVLASVSIAGTAQAQTYVEGTVGLTTYPKLEWNSVDYEVDQGSAWGLAIGHHFTPTLSAELEFTHTSGEYTGYDNSVTSNAFMANGYYRFMPGSTFRPYVGGGLGLVTVGYENVAPYEREDQILGWQVIGGGEVAVNPSISLFGEYRFQSATGAEDGPTAWDYQSHIFSVGARYNF